MVKLKNMSASLRGGIKINYRVEHTPEEEAKKD